MCIRDRYETIHTRYFRLGPIGAYSGLSRPTECSRTDWCNGPARAERAPRAYPWPAHCTSPSDCIQSAVMSPDKPR
eukprot:2397499-Alexandrium_andersonii.AAC.1